MSSEDKTSPTVPRPDGSGTNEVWFGTEFNTGRAEAACSIEPRTAEMNMSIIGESFLVDENLDIY